ncbi:DUF459 domain-containing protein, partial [Methylobacterium sp. W2]|nr:DUF459 domain-containing protein [Methylobacterium sp. W2]
MRDALLRACLLALFATPLLFTSGPSAVAQWGDSYDTSRGDSYYAPRRRPREEGDYGGRQANRRYAPPPQEAPRQFYWPWEDRPQQVQPTPPPVPSA